MAELGTGRKKRNFTYLYGASVRGDGILNFTKIFGVDKITLCLKKRPTFDLL